MPPTGGVVTSQFIYVLVNLFMFYFIYLFQIINKNAKQKTEYMQKKQNKQKIESKKDQVEVKHVKLPISCLLIIKVAS